MKISLEPLRPVSPLVLPLVAIGLASLAVGFLVVFREFESSRADRGPWDRPDSTFSTYAMEVLANGTIALDWERIPGVDSYILEYLAGDLSLVETAWVSPDLDTEIPYANPHARDHILYWRMVAYRDDQPIALSQLREYPSRTAIAKGGSSDEP